MIICIHIFSLFLVFPKSIVSFYNITFLKDFIYLFLETEEGRERVMERNVNVWLLLTYPQLGIWATTQACALTENGTRGPLVRRPVLNPQSLTSQGNNITFNIMLTVFHLVILIYEQLTSDAIQSYKPNFFNIFIILLISP